VARRAGKPAARPTVGRSAHATADSALIREKTIMTDLHGGAAPQHSENWRNADDHAAGASRYLEILSALLQPMKDRSIELLALKPGGSAIEIGCGLGHESEAMARIVGASGQVVGIDASRALLDKGMARTASLGLPLEFRHGDAMALPFADNSFDAGRGERVFEHLRDPGGAVKELVRVVRPGGRIAGLEPDFDTIAIGGVPLDITRAIVRHKVDVSLAHGSIGREMTRLLADAGCHDIYKEAGAVTFPSLRMANDVLSLRANVDGAREQGWISGQQAADWWSALEELDRRGAFSRRCAVCTSPARCPEKAYSALMPANLITLAHFSVASARTAAN
jgi:SAM-dependent methyltransferase